MSPLNAAEPDEAGPDHIMENFSIEDADNLLARK